MKVRIDYDRCDIGLFKRIVFDSVVIAREFLGNDGLSKAIEEILDHNPHKSLVKCYSNLGLKVDMVCIKVFPKGDNHSFYLESQYGDSCYSLFSGRKERYIIDSLSQSISDGF